MRALFGELIALLFVSSLAWAADPVCLNAPVTPGDVLDCTANNCALCTPPEVGTYVCDVEVDGIVRQTGPLPESTRVLLMLEPKASGSTTKIKATCSNTRNALAWGTTEVRPPLASGPVPEITLEHVVASDGRSGLQLCVDDLCEQVFDGKDGAPGAAGVCTEDVCKLKDHQHAPGGVLP